jgi:thymidine phosphorylase
VVCLSRNGALYCAEGFQALSKIEMRANGRHVRATLNRVDDDSIVACNEVRLSVHAFRHLGLPDGDTAAVSQAKPPASMEALHHKVNGERLNKEDFIAL